MSTVALNIMSRVSQSCFSQWICPSSDRLSVVKVGTYSGEGSYSNPSHHETPHQLVWYVRTLQYVYTTYCYKPQRHL